MKRSHCLVLLALFAGLAVTTVNASAATEEAKQAAIDAGLARLALQQAGDGSWPYGSGGTLAATGSATLAFLGEGYFPGDGSIYDAAVTNACNYMFNRLADQGPAGAFYFNPSAGAREVYTTGICLPVVYELGQHQADIGGSINSVVGFGAKPGLTYKETMQGIMDWFGYGQNPDGGWRYTANYGASDNSTAQWGSLAILYSDAWGCAVRDPANPAWDVKANLANWIAQIQHPNDGTWMAGGSGYTTQGDIVNMSKTGGLLLELAATGAPISDPRVQSALAFLQSMNGFDHWNAGPSGTWDGNVGHPYAMWAIYKALDVYGMLDPYAADPNDFLIGSGISTAPGGITIGFAGDPKLSLPGDWYSQYCQWIVSNQNANGSWNGYDSWTGALAEGWYINVLNAVAPPQQQDVIPEPLTMAGLFCGLTGVAAYIRRRRSA